jgi:hypothetical protein
MCTTSARSGCTSMTAATDLASRPRWTLRVGGTVGPLQCLSWRRVGCTIGGLRPWSIMEGSTPHRLQCWCHATAIQNRDKETQHRTLDLVRYRDFMVWLQWWPGRPIPSHETNAFLMDGEWQDPHSNDGGLADSLRICSWFGASSYYPWFLPPSFQCTCSSYHINTNSVHLVGF